MTGNPYSTIIADYITLKRHSLSPNKGDRRLVSPSISLSGTPFVHTVHNGDRRLNDGRLKDDLTETPAWIEPCHASLSSAINEINLVSSPDGSYPPPHHLVPPTTEKATRLRHSPHLVSCCCVETLGIDASPLPNPSMRLRVA